MKSRLPKNSRKSTATRPEGALAFPSAQTYPTEYATPQADHIDAAPVLQRYAQGGVVQLKGWKWLKASASWEEVDAKEQGSKVPPSFKGDDDGAVYSTATQNWYRSVAEYQKYTGRIQNPKFASAPQSAMDLMLLQAQLDKTIGPLPGSGDKLASFLAGGVKLPSQLGAMVTSSADEKGRPDQISVNKFGPFASDGDADATGKYAALNAANGAIPVVLENSADALGPDDEPDLHALAVRAHNSALAIIDPTSLDAGSHQAIKQIEGGEMTLRSGIPSSCFVAVLMPINMARLVSQEEIQKFNIQFVGSKKQAVSYNFRTADKGKSGMDVETSVPDYESALSAIFKANKGSIFLTHVIRMSPKTALPTVKASASAAAQDDSATLASALAAKASLGTHGSSAAMASTVVAHEEVADATATHSAAAPPPAVLTAGQIADAVVSNYPAPFTTEDAKITDADRLLQLHAAQGVTEANKHEVFAELQNYCDMR